MSTTLATPVIGVETVSASDGQVPICHKARALHTTRWTVKSERSFWHYCDNAMDSQGSYKINLSYGAVPDATLYLPCLGRDNGFQVIPYHNLGAAWHNPKMIPHILAASKGRVVKLGYKVHFFQTVLEEAQTISGATTLMNSFNNRPVLMRWIMNDNEWLPIGSGRRPSTIKQMQQLSCKCFSNVNNFLTHTEPRNIDEGKLLRLYTFSRAPRGGLTMADKYSYEDYYAGHDISFYSDGQSFEYTWCPEYPLWYGVGQTSDLTPGMAIGKPDLETVTERPFKIIGNFPTTRRWALE